MKRFIVECVGTFFLTSAIVFSNDPWAVGLMLMAMIYIGGHVSGGHYSWAVSLAAWLRGTLSMENLLMYMVAQVSGAFLASFSYFLLLGQHYQVTLPFDAPWVQLCAREGFLTFVLCSVILVMATTAKFRGSAVGGLVIGFTLTAIAIVGGVFFNPAVYIGAALCNVVGGTIPKVYELLAFIGAPLLGGACAAWMFKYLNPNEV